MEKFIQCSGPDGNAIWINPHHIVAFGIQPMSIRSKRGIGLSDGLWIDSVNHVGNDDNHSYVVDETPATLQEKIAHLES